MGILDYLFRRSVCFGIEILDQANQNGFTIYSPTEMFGFFLYKWYTLQDSRHVQSKTRAALVRDPLMLTQN